MTMSREIAKSRVLEKYEDKVDERLIDFAHRYSKTHNGTESYMLAYGNSNNASSRVIACRLLKKPEVVEMIEAFSDDNILDWTEGNKLTPRQIKFVAEIIVDGNPKKAAIRAGYNPKVAERYAYRFMETPHVVAAIREAMGYVVKRNGITADKVLSRIADRAFTSAKDFYDDKGKPIPVYKLDDHTASMVKEVDSKGYVSKFESSKDSLALLCKYLGLTNDNHINIDLSKTTTNNVQINTDTLSDCELLELRQLLDKASGVQEEE